VESWRTKRCSCSQNSQCREPEDPWGAGEPSAAVIPAAIANAVFDATGARLRSVPFTPAKVKAAMQAS
jgi:nicotinate dehydrogenase subunit B